MTRGENGTPETPDWSAEAKPCDLDHKCAGCQPRAEVEPLVELGEN